MKATYITIREEKGKNIHSIPKKISNQKTKQYFF